ncbi:MAG: exodeoxyribonuclease VII small subunit [Zoogloeaceae bacterium]|jgi:exodeoxyribonuclease VII small subunit|nr:exodeoxyribonuclease VII small subunit [Zoogloeaceae bacterium]
MATTSPESLPSDLKFETALAELDTLATRMEGGNLELEDSIAAYQRGMALLQHCQNQLKAAEARVKVLEAGTLKPFSPDGETA